MSSVQVRFVLFATKNIHFEGFATVQKRGWGMLSDIDVTPLLLVRRNPKTGGVKLRVPPQWAWDYATQLWGARLETAILRRITFGGPVTPQDVVEVNR
jgi:hypothetical protein